MKTFLKKIFGKKEKQQSPEQEKKPAAVDDFDCDPDTFHDLLQKKPNLKLIDVRTKEEYESGHIADAALLPVQELSQDKIDALGITKQDEILLYCRSGGRSGHALHVLQSLGYKKTKHLDGGILAWQEKNKPVQK